jgi:hypothetical protein
MARYSFLADSIEISPNGSKIYVEVSTKVDDILSEINIEDVVNHFGVTDLLSEIDVSDVVNHFGVTDLLSEIDVSDVISHYDLKIEE